jgi:hypothetical protein
MPSRQVRSRREEETERGSPATKPGGSGRNATDLELVDTRKVGPSVLLLTYRPASKAA